MYIKRYLHEPILELLKKKQKKNRVIVLYGPRQVGKTTLIKELIKGCGLKTKFFACDDPDIKSLLSGIGLSKLKTLVAGYDLVVFDEAQRIREIGTMLKLLIDYLPKKKVLVSGSSSLDLANKISEALTGRKKTFFMYPLSLGEVYLKKDEMDIKTGVDRIMRFGTYPVAFSLSDEMEVEDYLLELARDYLYKDALEYQQVKNTEQIRKLLVALALQIGQEVSYTELANTVGVDQKTVVRFIDLLEKSFVIFRLSAFSRNLRNELNKTRKIYFYDLGIRNALIKNFNNFELRNDKGNVWENFLIVERMKRDAVKKERKNYYFWRTYDKKEIDLIEERGGKLNGFEFKWNSRSFKKPKLFLEKYKSSSLSLVNRENFLDFVM
ncbi:ATP-binding protein [Patescibacteria group bacterium]|nr:ATP-binding protein [Patescibacteria group bacterium]MCG2702027.1 ATP-binding protein [Candidatus Parcubacteria bacterium]MBU4265547.1 ATP-binding protein [Patescibacteria group bacterium]MBU4389876.1 ATP-binding protein [Patescibacteria group bacterium]MBU4397251.1 ATP-binding protein [Patescibacteria group bacterium]